MRSKVRLGNAYIFVTWCHSLLENYIASYGWRCLYGVRQ